MTSRLAQCRARASTGGYGAGTGLAPAVVAAQAALVLLFVTGILSLPVVLTLLGVSLLPILASRRR